MKVLSRAMLLVALPSAALFSQTATSGNANSFDARREPAADVPQPIGALAWHDANAAVTRTSHGIEPFTCSAYNTRSSARLSLPGLNYRYAAPGTSATARSWSPVTYKHSKDYIEYFPLEFGPVRYTLRPRSSQYDRAAGGPLQNVVDNILRHYTWHPAVPLNHGCVRSLSCTSLYEQALRRRAVRPAY